VENRNIDLRLCKLCGKKFSSFAATQQRMTIHHIHKGDVSNTMANNSSIDVDISSPLAKFVTGKNYIRLFQKIHNV
jgi:hypothetical protein